MAAIQQQKGTGLGIQYEDLVPKFVWKDEPEATLITIELPGFAKEQIKVTYVHTSKMIRVTGERPLVDQRWSRFNEVYIVPQNCLVDKIHGSFKNNVLTITMPKETITKMAILPEVSKTVAAPPEMRLSEEAKVEEAEHKKKQLLEEREGLIRKLQEEEAKAKEKDEAIRKLQEEVKAKENSEERKLVEEATLEKIKERKLVNESEGKEKIVKPEEKMLPEMLYKKSGPVSGGGRVGEVVKSAEEKLGCLVEKEKKIGKGIMEKIKGKEITSEDKKLMVNVGVAALVIFALGAYVSYTFRSSSSSATASSSPSPSSRSSSTKQE